MSLSKFIQASNYRVDNCSQGGAFVGDYQRPSNGGKVYIASISNPAANRSLGTKCLSMSLEGRSVMGAGVLYDGQLGSQPASKLASGPASSHSPGWPAS